MKLNALFYTYRWLILVLALTSLAYAPVINTGFVWDDRELILDWEVIHDFDVAKIIAGDLPGDHTGAYRPIRNLYSSFNYQLYRNQPLGYHLAALGTHLTITGLVYLITLKITNQKSLAIIASLLFGLHPIHVEAIAWISASNDAISYIFFLSTFLVFLQTQKTKHKNKILALLSFLAFCTYELTLTLPLTLAAYEYIVGKNLSIKKLWLKLKPVVFAFGCYWAVRLLLIEDTIGRGAKVIPWIEQRVLTIILSIGKYLQILLLPLQLTNNHQLYSDLPSLFNLDYNSFVPVSIPPLSPQVLLSLAGLLVVLGLIVSLRQKLPFFSFGLAWMLLGLLPVIQLLPQPILVSERYAYVSSIGFCIALASLLMFGKNHFKLHKQLVTMIIILIGSAYFLITFNRIPVWQSDLVYWQTAVAQNPQSAIANSMLGVEYALKEDWPTSFEYSQKAVELNPSYAFYKNRLGFHYKKQENWSAYIELYRSILEEYPQAKTALAELGYAHTQIQAYDQAIDYYSRLLELDPHNQEALLQLRQLHSLVE